MGTGTLTNVDSNLHELLTEILDQSRWWKTINLILGHLWQMGISRIDVKFGWVLDLDLAGREQGKDQTVEIGKLEKFIADGLKDGTIEFKGGSDFVFRSDDGRFLIMLCNDGDIHFSASKADAYALGKKIKASGVEVYDSGKPI